MIMKDGHTQSEGACLLVYAVHDLCVFGCFSLRSCVCTYVLTALGSGWTPRYLMIKRLRVQLPSWLLGESV